jgi:hypothetical protein
MKETGKKEEKGGMSFGLYTVADVYGVSLCSSALCSCLLLIWICEILGSFCEFRHAGYHEMTS